MKQAGRPVQPANAGAYRWLCVRDAGIRKTLSSPEYNYFHNLGFVPIS